ncbi:MAG TPA: hypothetical protein VHD62_14000 [Opitutaceae bacterium]|nr:hypothetical protein [Opitutaceae bacterium]
MRLLLATALALIALALGLRWIAADISDAPRAVDFAPELRDVFSNSDAAGWSVFSSDDFAGAHLWQRGWLALNGGQADARVLALATLVLQIAALVALFALLAREVRLRWLVPLGLVALLLPFTSAFATLRPDPHAASVAGLVLLSSLHLALMARRDARSPAWWLGLALGGLNLLAATAGLASAAALVLWCALARRGGATLRANALLLAGGLALALVRAPEVHGEASPAQLFSALLAWPYATRAWALAIWAPAILALTTARRRHPCERTLLACWAAAQALALAAFIGRFAVEPSLVLASGILANLACFTLLPAADRTDRTRNAVLLGVWLIVVGNGLLDPAPSFRDSPSPAATPDSVGTPLALVAENAAPASAFRGDATPDLPGRDGLPAIGTPAAAGGAATGEFVSAPLATRFPLLQIRVSGTLRPPATSLVLRTADGREIAPLAAPFTSLERWKRVNFPAPRGPFRIVARDASATAWLAFTAPVELGELTHLAGKIPPLWPWCLAAGVALAAAAAAFHAGKSAAKQHERAEDFVAWRALPWIALLGYAVFLSHHVDGVAGPNDSGGYLNSAKLLARGEATAAPRTLFGPAAGENDAAAYAPITFHARADGRLVPEYPMGWPLEIAALAHLISLERAIRLLILAHLVLGVVLTQRLGRVAGLSAGWSWFGAAIIALSPVYLFEGLQPVSDGPALVWVAAAIYCAWTSRDQPWRAALAGLATALAVMIRPSNLLCAVPICFCLAGRGGLRRIATWALAGLPGAVALLWYQHALYGHAFTTGYGDVSTSFGARFLVPTLGAYATWLPELFTPLVVLALVAPFTRSIAPRPRLVLGSWAAVFVAFYAFYWCTWDNWYNMRFLLPAAPALVVLSLLVAQNTFARVRETPRRAAVGALSIGLLLVLIARDFAREVLYWPGENRKHAVAAMWAREHLPANAVVFAKHATGSLFFYTDLVFVRTDHAFAQSPEFLTRIAVAGRPIYALTYHWETRGYEWGHGRGSGRPDLPGEWKHIASIWEGELTVWQRVGP